MVFPGLEVFLPRYEKDHLGPVLGHKMCVGFGVLGSWLNTTV